MPQQIAWVFLVLLTIGVGVYLYKVRPKSEDDGAPMPRAKRLLLTLYLLAFGSGLVFMLVSLNSLDFPETPVIPRQAIRSPTPAVSPTSGVPTRTTPPAAPATRAAAGAGGGAVTPAATPSPTPVGPLLIQVFPQYTVGSGEPTVSLTLYGRNFNRESTVRFNAEPVAIEYLSDSLITAQLQTANMKRVGSITVDVLNPGDLLSNAITVPVQKPKVPLNVLFLWYPWITREGQLLLLVIFAGALGSYLHSVMSLADFIGNRTLTASWFWWYITRPFLGGAMGLVFYAVLRGGFLAGSPADANVVNPFGVLAIGALVGMFADKAAQKLGEVFDVVFRSSDPRTGKLNAPVIDRLVPDTVFAGGAAPVTVKIIGDRLGKVSIVRLNSEDRKPDSVSEKEISFRLTPEDIKNEGQIKVTAVNPDGGVSAAATLHVSDLTITDAALPNGKADTDYTANIAASGGTQPFKWSLVNPPKWLSIDEKTGALKGKPGTEAVKDIKVSVKVVDKDGASHAKELNLKVVA